MKKILHMTPADIRSGVYRYVFSNLEHMDAETYQFGFLTRAADQLEKCEEYKKLNFHIHPFFSTQRDDPDRLIREVKNVLSDYDIIHLHTSSWRGFLIEELAMEMKLQKVIVHSHSTGIDITNEEERKKQIEEHIVYRNQFSEKYATDFCACSHNAAEWLFGESIPKYKIKYMPNAVDTLKFKYDDTKRNKIRNQWGLTSKFVIGHVGRYSYTKNQQFLFECIYELKKSIPNIMLICIGQGELQQEFEQAIIKMHLEKNIFLLGWQDNIEDYLSAFDLFCLPSKFEGFPISLVEAQTSGLPCLVSNNVTREVKLTDLIEYLPNNCDVWVDRILYYIKAEKINRLRYREEICSKGYDIRQSARKLENLYK